MTSKHVNINQGSSRMSKCPPSPVVIFKSHTSSGEKCVEIVKTLHVKFFPFGSVEPVGSVTVKIES